MRKYRKWVLTLGIMAATPGIASAANPLAKFFQRKSPRRIATQTSRTTARVSNQKVAEDIAAALRTAKLNGYMMDVEFADGVCTLIGKIGNAAQKAQVTRVVQSVRGVRRVDNQLSLVQKSKSPFAGLNFGKKPVKQADYK
ncbi:MAG: BON domain-containing protein, partial [Proteobacteria bacterium]|nr:BON domain-containing protein [Pseudomonadota bacterium]